MIKGKRSGSELFHNFDVDHVQHVISGEDGEIIRIDDYACDKVAFAEEGETGYIMPHEGDEIKGHVVFVVIKPVPHSPDHNFARQSDDRVHRVGRSNTVQGVTIDYVHLDEIGHEGWEERMKKLFADKKVAIHDISLGPVVDCADMDILLTTVGDSMHPNINTTFRTKIDATFLDPKTAAALGDHSGPVRPVSPADPDHEPKGQFDAEGYTYLSDDKLKELAGMFDPAVTHNIREAGLPGKRYVPLRDDHHSDHSVPQGFASQVLNTVRTRGGDYGTPSENHELTANMLSSWFSRKFGDDVTFTAEDVVMFNVIQKVSRLAYSSKDDSYLDIAGYCENVAMLTPEQRRR